MFEIAKNGIVTITRGDTFTFNLTINLGTDLCPNYYVLGDNDKVYFALMLPNQPFECAIVKKVLTKDDVDMFGNVVINFDIKDTENLLPGTYYYMIKLHRVYVKGSLPDELDTIIQKTQFIILD